VRWKSSNNFPRHVLCIDVTLKLYMSETMALSTVMIAKSLDALSLGV
jgi:hypothetical protein